MKLSLNWIGLFTDIQNPLKNLGVRGLAHEYSIHSAEIEWADEYRNIDLIVVGKVLKAERHPESGKLWICEVDVWSGIRETILTGAPNVYAGMYTAVALVGCQLSPDFVIGERKMAGMISRGMMCGTNEIGLTVSVADGIIDLAQDFWESELSGLIGTSVFDLQVEVLGAQGKPVRIPLTDNVYEIDNKNITNRPDLFGIYGHAREFSTIFQLGLQPIQTKADLEIGNLAVDIESDRVSSYCLAKIEGVKNGPTPLGMKILLERSWHGSHDAIVDMTNYSMMEMGQPMHAFDADTIEGNVVVRQARPGEEIVALDGKTYTLTSDDIVIADSKKILGIAGVMGGLDSGITSETKNICVESAVFDPVSIRLTAQRLGLRSDASTRYEKSLDPLLSSRVLRRAIDLLNFEKVGGNAVGYFDYLNSEKVRNITFKIQQSFIESRLGISISSEQVLQTLKSLEFTVQYKDNEYIISVPSHRATKDISIPEDIVEEIGRMYGYDLITEAPIQGSFTMTTRNDWVALRNQIQNYMSGKGWYEAYNYSFSNEAKDAAVLITDQSDAILIQNAVSEEYTMMRRSLAPLLFANARENLKQRNSIGFYEIAKAHFKQEGKMMEIKKLAGVITDCSADQMRKLLDGLMDTLQIRAEVEQGSGLAFLHPNSSGTYSSQGKAIGCFGSVHPKVLLNFELPTTTWYFEIDIAVLVESMAEKAPYVEPNKYPSISRELNFLLESKQSTGEVAKLIANVDPRIHSLRIVDIYEHEKIGAGKKSVTFSFIVEDRAKTITDEEAQNLQNRVIESLEKKGFLLRR